MVIVLSITIVFAFVAYRAFIKAILNEKQQQCELDLIHQKEISQQYTNVQESERKRIAEILHDDVGSKLNILSLWINNEDTWNSERSKEIIAQQIPALIEATRNVSHALYPVKIEQLGLVLAIEELIAHVDSSLLVRLIINFEYHTRAISFEVQLYRIIQEFLSNVIKHSKASEMNIHFRDAQNALSIILSDNGVGFDVNKVSTGMGLKNIETRIQSINALYKWRSELNKGTALIIIFLK